MKILLLKIISVINFIILFNESLLGVDPFNRLRYNQYHYIASFNEKFNDIGSPALYNVYPESDSTINIVFNSLAQIDDNIPNVKSGLMLNGKFGNFTFLIEPILVNEVYGRSVLGADYSRNNLSGRFENSFIRYSNTNISISLGRSALLWGQSLSNSIIHSGMYPSYDHIMIKYNFSHFSYDLFAGQLGSGKIDDGSRIKRNIGGHRIVLKSMIRQDLVLVNKLYTQV